MSELKIKDISIYSFLVLIFGVVLIGTVLFISLNKIKSLNNQLTEFSNAKNSFLEVKINSENILITRDLDETIKRWYISIEKFDKSINSLPPIQKNKFDDLWYISKKEINEIKIILDNANLRPQNLHQKPILVLKGELFTLKDESDQFIIIESLIRKIEYLFQYEKFILDEFGELDKHDKAHIDEQITLTTYYSIFFILFIICMTIFVIFIMNKKILKIEVQLMQTQKSLSESLMETKNSRLLLQNIIDSVPASVFWKDKDNKYLGVNNYFLNDAKCNSQAEVIGKTDYEMPWKDTEAAKYIEDDNFVMQSGKSQIQIEETQTDEFGNIIYVITSKVPLLNIKNEIIGMLGIYIDVTENRKITNELIQKDRLLSQQSKMAAMGEMLENIAHQWRQPLSFILTSATGIRLKNDYECLDSNFLKETLIGIENTIKHLNKTIDDFRDYFKVDKECKFFEVEAVIEKSLFIVQSKLKNRSIDVIKNISPVKGFGFENEFIQVLMNIFNNSIDEFEKSELEKKLIFIEVKEIEICGSRVSSEVAHCTCIELKIYDNAGGISEKIIDKVFNAYFTTKEEDKGTGIGLFMSSEMIKKHMKGSITVKNRKYSYENNEYLGAEFTVLIPSEDYTIVSEK
jgi:signal transduction histidine kinase